MGVRETVAVLALLSAFGSGSASGPAWGEDDAAAGRAEVRVGIDEGDFRGRDGRVIQAAVDYLSGLGGGTVRVGPGRYVMRDSLILRDNVRVVGEPGKTVLVSCDAHQTPLASTGGTNERQISVADPSGFRVGDGIMVQDDESKYGFAVTQATITARLGENAFAISRPLERDYSIGSNARATSAFPVVGMWNVTGAALQGLTIDGNGKNMQYLTGCKGGGIYLFECRDVTIRDCTVRNYNGDAISFQASSRVVVEDCACEDNLGVGLHPGCGSEHATVRRNRCTGNQGDGLFVCWRVKHSLFEGNALSDNDRNGISIGHKDSENVFRDNTIAANAKAGIVFRDQPAPGGAHRNLFESNRILDNAACVVIRGHHHDLVFRKNVMGRSQPGGDPLAGIDAGDGAEGLKLEDNEFLHVAPTNRK